MPRSRKSKPAPRATGRPRIELDREALRALAVMQGTYDEMAAVMGCSPDTLTRHYKDVIDAARATGRMSLRRFQYVNARNGNATMQIWLGKQWLGQKDVATIETRELPGWDVVVEQPKHTVK